jgi:hypothetical protein
MEARIYHFELGEAVALRARDQCISTSHRPMPERRKLNWTSG